MPNGEEEIFLNFLWFHTTGDIAPFYPYNNFIPFCTMIDLRDVLYGILKSMIYLSFPVISSTTADAIVDFFLLLMCFFLEGGWGW